MATIYPQASQQQQPQQLQQPQLQQQTAQSTQDPLFEALVKYITSAPGASSTTATQLQEIIDTHASVPGGRAYLEGLVAPEPIPPIRIWKNSSPAHGFVSTNMGSLTLVFTAPAAYVSFKGTASGFFGPAVWQFEDAIFYWDEDFSQATTPVNMQIAMLPQSNQMIVRFFAEVSIEPSRTIAELVINNVGMRLPPQGVEGKGSFTQIYRTQ